MKQLRVYIKLLSFNYVILIVSELRSCDIQTNRQTEIDKRDEIIGTTFFAFPLRNPKTALHMFTNYHGNVEPDNDTKTVYFVIIYTHYIYLTEIKLKRLNIAYMLLF